MCRLSWPTAALFTSASSGPSRAAASRMKVGDARRVGHVDRADVERVGVLGGEVLELGGERAGERRDPRAAGERVAHDREAEPP